jgi:cytochrome c553
MENRLPDWFPIAIMSVLAGMLFYFLVLLFTPKLVTTWVASLATVALLVFGLWPEEVARESIRKPYVAGQYVYSNQVIARDVPGLGIHSEIPTLEKVGILKAHPFLPENLRSVTEDNKIQVGEAIALTYCSNCHSLSSTGIRPLARYFGGNTDVSAIKAYLLGGLATGNTLYMPEMPLKDDEATALAEYIAGLAVTQKTAVAQ